MQWQSHTVCSPVMSIRSSRGPSVTLTLQWGQGGGRWAVQRGVQAAGYKKADSLGTGSTADPHNHRAEPCRAAPPRHSHVGELEGGGGCRAAAVDGTTQKFDAGVGQELEGALGTPLTHLGNHLLMVCAVRLALAACVNLIPSQVLQLSSA